ncbi:MAG: SDR family oxidoreductase [Pseudomonadota bacterium]
MQAEKRTDSTLGGKVVLVTGGSSGIGAATVRAFAEQGATLVIGYHQGRDRAEALRAALPAVGGPGHRVLHMPLEDSAVHADIAHTVQQAFGRLDVLVNSAGYTKRIAHADLETMDSALFNQVLLSNVGGVFSITRALLPLLQKSTDALVVSMSSVSGFTGSGSSIAYCAAKSALDTLMVSLARAFGPVRFLSVSPASVDTQFIPGRDHAELEAKAAKTPLGRIVSPEDVAQAILACATHLRTATGSRIVIDGGFHL